MFRVISELAEEDAFTVSREELLKACAAILENRQKATTEDVSIALRSRALAYAAANKPSAAKADLDDLCKLCPNDAKAYRLRAMFLADQQCLVAAQLDVETAIGLQPKSADNYACLASILFLGGQFERGLCQARRAVEIDSHCAFGHYILGLLSLEIGANRACVKHLSRYLELQPWNGLDSARPYYTRGLALLELNRPKEALISFFMARKLDPSLDIVVWSIAVTYEDLGRFHAAARAAEDFIKMKPRPSDHFWLATLHASSGHKALAEQSIRKGEAAVWAAGAETAAAAGEAYYAVEQYQKSVDYIRMALKLEPANELALRQQAETQATCPEAKYRDGPAAVKVAQRLYDGVKDNPDKVTTCRNLMVLLAAAHAECGQFQRAVELMRAFVEHEGPDRNRTKYQQMLRLFESGKPYRHSAQWH